MLYLQCRTESCISTVFFRLILQAPFILLSSEKEVARVSHVLIITLRVFVYACVCVQSNVKRVFNDKQLTVLPPPPPGRMSADL